MCLSVHLVGQHVAPYVQLVSHKCEWGVPGAFQGRARASSRGIEAIAHCCGHIIISRAGTRTRCTHVCHMRLLSLSFASRKVNIACRTVCAPSSRQGTGDHQIHAWSQRHLRFHLRRVKKMIFFNNKRKRFFFLM